MSIELYTELEQLYYKRKEDKRKLEEEIWKLEAKIYVPKEAKETSKPSKDRKSSRSREKTPISKINPRAISDQETYIGRFIWPRGETNSTLSESSHFFSLGKRSQDHGRINKANTTIKVYANKHSNFSFKVNDSLSIIWYKPRRRFVLRCPLYFKTEIHLHKIQPLGNYDPALNPVTKLSLRLPRITILDQNGILFLFQPVM